MCNRCLSGRPSIDFEFNTIHKREDYTEEEWELICKKRLELTMQDPDTLISYEVFV